MKVKSYVIGITGHRDLNSVTFEQLSLKISEFLDEIKSLLPNTPIKVISGMADGADRILVREALKKGIAVDVIQPMPDLLYRTDFSDSSWQDFQEIIADKNVATRILSDMDLEVEKYNTQGVERDSLYHALGKYIVEQSNIVTTVWDGVNSGLKGGTADVVLSYLNAKNIDEEIVNEAVSFVGDEVSVNESSNSVYWLAVSKEKEAYHQTDESVSAPCYLTGCLGEYTAKKHDVMPQKLCQEIQDIDEYNQTFKSLNTGGKITTEYSLLTSYQASDNTEKNTLLKNIDDEFLKADAIALSHQKKSDGQFKLFAYMAALMGLFFLVYAKIIASKFLLILYLLLFVLGWFFFKSAEKNKCFIKHLTARVFAETLRTQFYLTLIGKPETIKVVNLMDDTGISQFKGASWLKQAVISLLSEHKQGIEESSISKKEEDMAFVCQHWLVEQAKYFKNKTKNLSSHHHKLEKIKGILFAGSAIATISLILFKYQLVDIVLFAHVDAKTFTVLLMGLLPFWLAVWELYQNKMAIKELLWQYQNQSIAFSQAQREIENATTLEQKSDVLVRLAHRSMMENYIWIIHRYHREHEPPTAG